MSASTLIVLVMGLHNIHLVERLGTRRTLPHAVADAIFNTILAEEMSTCFEDPVFEVLLANGTDRKALSYVSTMLSSGCRFEKGNHGDSELDLLLVLLLPLKCCSMLSLSNNRDPSVCYQPGL